MDVKGFSPGGDSCGLREYAVQLGWLDRVGAISPSQRADLCTEELYAMGDCARLCVDSCMASTFFPYSTDLTPHTRHPIVPYLANDRAIKEL